ncbi:MAG: hypothetical protein HY682_08405 [Chloroflexi bacterium]|nr:hypothetical protein [Chloroflexota bacterium]
MSYDAVRQFLKDLTPSDGNPLFEKLHDQIRDVMHGYAIANGYSFSRGELEEVLWDYGLGHEQVDLAPVDKNSKTALNRINARFAKERAAGKGRGDKREEEIRQLTVNNVGEWKNATGAKRVDEHAAFIIVHSAVQ